MTPALSIVIVSYNAAAELDACLTSLASASRALAIEAIVVDNASRDDGPRRVAERHPFVRFVALDRNVGFARANNVGLRRASAETCLLLNSDTVVPEGALEGLLAALAESPDAAVVGPRLVRPDGRPELSWGAMIAPFAEARRKSLLWCLDRGEPWAVRRVAHLTSERRIVDWVSGACLLVRRVDAVAVDLLDERYFMYTEDVDFCASIRASGRLVVFDPRVSVVHKGGASVATARAATYEAYRRSHLAFYEKHHPGWVRLLRAYLRLRGRLPAPTA
ncbi:MAG: glycosyltransferase family 2 protein [Vicinamibacterales bacterium]